MIRQLSPDANGEVNFITHQLKKGIMEQTNYGETDRQTDRSHGGSVTLITTSNKTSGDI